MLIGLRIVSCIMSNTVSGNYYFIGKRELGLVHLQKERYLSYLVSGLRGDLEILWRLMHNHA